MKERLVLVAFAVASLIGVPAWSDDNSGENSAVAAPDTNAAAPASKQAPQTAAPKNEQPAGNALQGGVKGTALPFSEGVGRIGEACGNIDDAMKRIAKEAARQDTLVFRGPNVLPNGTVIPAIGGVGGVVQMGSMPIHKDKFLRWLSVSEQNLAALDTYVNALIVPADKPVALVAYKAMRDGLLRAQTHMDLLKELSTHKRLDNDRIFAEAEAIRGAADEILRQRSVIQSALSIPN